MAGKERLRVRQALADKFASAVAKKLTATDYAAQARQAWANKGADLDIAEIRRKDRERFGGIVLGPCAREETPELGQRGSRSPSKGLEMPGVSDDTKPDPKPSQRGSQSRTEAFRPIWTLWECQGSNHSSLCDCDCWRDGKSVRPNDL